MSFETMSSRIQYLGGSQRDRIDKQKLRSLQWVLKNDYNTRMIKVENHGVWPCLINTLTGGNKADYNKEVVSVEFESGLAPGDTFETLDDGTHWMVYLPYVTETAYLRSEIIRCRYQLEVNGQKYWVAVRGPVETDLRWFIKNNINVNELNLSSRIYIKNDDNTKNHFARFTKLKLDGHTWEVQVTDSLSVPGVLELDVQEYYDNSIEELPEVLTNSSESSLNVISGDTVVKQDSVNGYAITNEAYDPSIEWEIKNNDRVKILETFENGRMCKVKVFPGAIKTYDVCYGEQFITVTIDWQKPLIQGPQEVYPYDSHTYWIKNLDESMAAKFSIDDESQAIITDSGRDYCKVDVIAGKKGKFNLSVSYGDVESTLPVKIKSL